jgi:hypothetical protein
MLLFSAGLASGIQESQRRVGSKSTENAGAASQPNGTISECSYAESLLVVASTFQSVLDIYSASNQSVHYISREKCQSFGVSYTDAVFYKVT